MSAFIDAYRGRFGVEPICTVLGVSASAYYYRASGHRSTRSVEDERLVARLWVADFTYLRCWEGVVFFAFVIDAYDRQVLGWQFAPHMRTTLVLDALQMALSMTERVEQVELVHHSDAGSQYTSFDYNQTLDDHHVLGSIGSVGDAYDNALAESFVDTFKTELIRDRIWRSRSQLELAIVEYVAWYNTHRLHSALGDVPPSEYHQLTPRR